MLCKCSDSYIWKWIVRIFFIQLGGWKAYLELIRRI